MATRPPLPPFSRLPFRKFDCQRMAGTLATGKGACQRRGLWWRNWAEFPNGRAQIVAFLTRKWTKELDYRLIKGTVGLH
jgi:nuclear transport factor 2 (NTF2) superfamily protein